MKQSDEVHGVWQTCSQTMRICGGQAGFTVGGGSKPLNIIFTVVHTLHRYHLYLWA